MELPVPYKDSRILIVVGMAEGEHHFHFVKHLPDEREMEIVGKDHYPGMVLLDGTKEISAHLCIVHINNMIYKNHASPVGVDLIRILAAPSVQLRVGGSSLDNGATHLIIPPKFYNLLGLKFYHYPEKQSRLGLCEISAEEKFAARQCVASSLSAKRINLGKSVIISFLIAHYFSDEIESKGRMHPEAARSAQPTQPFYRIL